MSVVKNMKYILYASNNILLFNSNLFFWFLLKFMFAFYNGINVYFILYGFLCWSFWEYTYHRFAMHGLKNTVYYYKMHGYHHTYPEKTSHIPIFQYIIVFPVFIISSYFIHPSIVFSYSIGHLSGLMCFEKMHYYIHNDNNNDKTNNNEIQIYSKYHMYHHKNSHKAFCFTTPCFDILFDTFPKEQFSYNIIGLLPIPYIGFWGIRENNKK